MGNNNSLAHRYRRKGLIALAGIWAFISLAAAGEAIHTRMSVPAHHRTLVDLLAAEHTTAQMRVQLGRVEAWGECLAEYTLYLSAEYRRRGSIEYPNAPAKCNDPR